MMTKDDLKDIANTISPLIKAEGDLIRKSMVTRGYLDANNRILGQIVRIDQLAQKQEIMNVMKAGFQEVGKLIKEVRDEIHNEKIKKLEERIEKLEKKQSQTHH